MLFSDRERGDTVYVDKDDVVEVPFNGSKITINGFSLCASSIHPYSIALGEGKNGNHRVLVARALAHGMRGITGGGINQTEYICAPISDYYRETVRRDIESYREREKERIPELADADIILWPELSQDQK